VLPDRFWIKVTKTDDCWLWTGSCDKGGYGRFQWRYEDGRRRPALAYVLAWEDENGPVPEGLELDHTCEANGCVRPSHLEPVTHQENLRRRYRRHDRPCARGHRNWYIQPDGRRRCRDCMNAKRRDWDRARNAA
jgi:hypothetical protein